MRKLIILLLALSFLIMWGVLLAFSKEGVDMGYLITTVIFSALPLIFIILIWKEQSIIEKFPALIFFTRRDEVDESLWNSLVHGFFDILGITGVLISAYLIVVQYTAFDYIRRRDVPNPEFFITFAVITPMVIFAIFLYMMYRLASRVEDSNGS